MSGRYEIVSTRTYMQKRLLCAPLWLAGASGCSAFAQLKKIVIGEADHISRSPLAVIRWRKSHFCMSQTGASMKRLLNFGFVLVALGLLVFAKSHSPSDNRSAGSALAKNSTSVTGVSKLLPVEEFEDMSLVFSTPTKH